AISEVAGRISNLDNNTDTQLRPGNPWFKNNPAWKSFAPPVGVAWDPFKDGKMSVRGGVGIFYDIFGPAPYQGAAQYNPPYFIQVNINNPVFPNVYSTLTNVAAVTPGLWVVPAATSKQPYVMQQSLTIQREVMPNTVVQVGYFGTRGVHLS